MKPELWPYSNYLEWIEERPGTLVDRTFIQVHFGRVNDYRAYVSSYLTGEVELPAALNLYFLVKA
ncbi:hypothetical protein KFU94_60415 [Chloroflexi bacterium TSY]|nr:hypothetical protein [Chloroflexi bacterium TSY]